VKTIETGAVDCYILPTQYFFYILFANFQFSIVKWLSRTQYKYIFFCRFQHDWSKERVSWV